MSNVTTDLINRPFGGDLPWDDLRVPVTSTVAAGSNPPEFALFKTNGAVPPVGYALKFDGVNDYATIPHDDSTATDVFDFSSSWSLSFWAVINAGNANNATLFYHPQWNLRIGPAGILRLSLSGNPDQNSIGAYNIGSRNHVVLTVEETGGNINIIIYIDSNVVLDTTFAGSLAADAGGNVIVASNAGTSRFLAGTFDDIRFYDSVLTVADVLDLYNNEAGTEDDVQLGNTTSHYKLNEGTGTTAADYQYGGATTHTMTLTNGVLWTTGIVEVVNPEQGVFTWSFSPDTEEELFFTCQLPHTWIEYASLHAHVHWSPDSNATGVVVWGLEYTWANRGQPFGNTTVITLEADAEGEKYHLTAGFDPIEGADKTMSSMIVGRIFRKATDDADTYTGHAYLLEIDFHYQYNHGSFYEHIKE